MMKSKADLFEDHATRDRILSCDEPAEMKRLGRQVSNFTQSVWEECREGIVLKACSLKFEQNPDVRNQLLATGRTLLMEVNPNDQVWSIGISQEDAQAGVTPTGLGLLGKVLMRVRDRIRLSNSKKFDSEAVSGDSAEGGPGTAQVTNISRPTRSRTQRQKMNGSRCQRKRKQNGTKPESGNEPIVGSGVHPSGSGVSSELSTQVTREWAASVSAKAPTCVKQKALSVLREWDQEITVPASGSQPDMPHMFLSDGGLPVDEAALETSTIPDLRPLSGADTAMPTCQREENELRLQPARSLSLLDFTYVEVFAGSSAFSEQARHDGGHALGFIEWEQSDHALLKNMCPDAWIHSDFYDYEWKQQGAVADALLAWPMCKHLAIVGRRLMHKDPVASQLWDIIDCAIHFDVGFVGIENVPRLELDNELHQLVPRALHLWEAAGFVLSSFQRVCDADLGGYTWRERAWITLEPIQLSQRLPPLNQPAMTGEPQGVRECLLELSDVLSLEVKGLVTVQPSGFSPGCFHFDWSRPLQPGLIALSVSRQIDCCVYLDEGDVIRVRSTDYSNPFHFNTTFDDLADSLTPCANSRCGLTGGIVIRSLDSPCHTIRSSPDPPGNCLWWDDRISPPFPRRQHAYEVWLLQGRSPDQLDEIADLGDQAIIHKAGKGVTACMAQYMVKQTKLRSTQLKCAKAGGMSPLAESSLDFVLFVAYSRDAEAILTSVDGSLLPGQFLSKGRDAVTRLAENWVESHFKYCSPTKLVGESKVGRVFRWVVACPFESALTPPSWLEDIFQWTRTEDLKGSDVWSIVVSAKLKLCEYFKPSMVRWHPELATGSNTVAAIQDGCTASSLTWSEHCAAATKATRALKEAFDKQAARESTTGMAEYLLSWHCKIDAFDPDSIPVELRRDIPDIEGFSLKRLPWPHVPPATNWLPLKPPQPKLVKSVSGVKDLFTEAAWAKIQEFLYQQDKWLCGAGARPDAVAINARDFVHWARGTVLDLRRVYEGVVTELDYTTPPPTKFNTAAIQDALSECEDQEIVSFMVLGVRLKADLAHQFVLNHHLMNLVGHQELVWQGLVELAEYGWTGLFKHPPMLPCRFNGKGLVEQGKKKRPVDEAGGPRKPAEDSCGMRVYSLNEYVNGDELCETLLGDDLSRQREQNKGKWPHEDKPSVKDVRKANPILKEIANETQQGVYAVSADWFKWFNQFVLATEEIWKSCHCFPGDRYAVNYSMTFGITCASNISQRAANAFIWFFLREFEKLDSPFLEEEILQSSELRCWMKKREKLGPAQATLLWMCCYTDDPLWVIVGADRVVRAVKLFKCICHLFGFLPAHVDKHLIGIKTTWIGITHHVLFALTEVPERKALKAICGLTQMVNGEMSAQDATSLLGLLEHIRYALGVRFLRLFMIYFVVNRLESADRVRLYGEALERAKQWMSILQTSRGSAVVTLLDAPPPDFKAWAWSIFSDAALEPPDEAGIGGFIAGHHWRVPRDHGLTGLTIPVLELLAAGVNLEVLYQLLGRPISPPNYWVRWEIDALGAHFVLLNESAKSPMMQLVHKLITESAAFKYFESALILTHTYGPANPADAASRGKLEHIDKLSNCLKFTLSPLQLHAEAQEMIDRTMEGQQSSGTQVSWLTPGFCKLRAPLIPTRPTSGKRTTPSSIFKTPPLVPIRPHSSSSAANPIKEVPVKLIPARPSVATQRAVQPAHSRLGELVHSIGEDSSKYAIAPGNPVLQQSLCTTAHRLLSKSYNKRTTKRDQQVFNKWAAYCRAIGTHPWRDDTAANSGADLAGHQREVILMINALVYFQQTGKPRPNGSSRTLVKPESAMHSLRAVRRIFKANMIPLLDLTAVNRALHALTSEFIRKFGQNAVTPRRAAPFTNEILRAMLTSLDTIAISSNRQLDLSSFEGLNIRAALALAKSSAMRKSELVSGEGSQALLVSNVAFLIRGVLKTRPTTQDLEQLGVGDFLVVTPPPSKADPFGVVWGSLPIYIKFSEAADNTARIVAALLKQRPEASASEPLLCSSPGTPLTHSFMDRALKPWIKSVGVSDVQAELYSWHSARSYLACALMAAGRPPHVVQALCRWQSVDSLRTYSCLNPASYASHLQAAETATVAGIRGAHIPLIDSLDMAFQMQQPIVAA